MKKPKQTNLEMILYGANKSGAEETDYTPSSATLLVSLFLILITFFVLLNNHAKPDAAKRKVAFESMKEKFGLPTDELTAFSSIVPPKISELTLLLETTLQNNARIETTLDSLQVKAIFAKDLFFYTDETEIKQDKIELAQKLSATLKKAYESQNIKISIIAGQENFDLDSKKLIALKNAIGISQTEIGLQAEPNTDTNISANQFTLVITNEQ